VIAVEECWMHHEARNRQHPRVITPHFSFSNRWCPQVVPQPNYASAYIPLVAMHAAIGHHSPKPALLGSPGPTVVRSVRLRQRSVRCRSQHLSKPRSAPSELPLRTVADDTIFNLVVVIITFNNVDHGSLNPICCCARRVRFFLLRSIPCSCLLPRCEWYVIRNV
jgi:hypothetical protein